MELDPTIKNVLCNIELKDFFIPLHNIELRHQNLDFRLGLDIKGHFK